MPEVNEVWPGDVFIDAYRHDVQTGNNLVAPKWLMLSRTARRSLIEFVRGHAISEIDSAVDIAQETVRGEIQT